MERSSSQIFEKDLKLGLLELAKQARQCRDAWTWGPSSLPLAKEKQIA
jgi:hypothetical protein